MSSITLITGIMASGKSSVAEALARELSPGVHLRGDVFRRMIVSGREEMDSQLSEEALRQLQLRYRLAVQTARTYYEAGFNVFYQDVIIGPVLADVVQMFGELPVEVIVLCPRREVVERREAEREKTGYRGFTVEELDRSLRESTPRIGRWLDTSDLSLEETVREIIGDDRR